jgi:hypothetical protein
MTNEEKQQSLTRARALLEQLADMPPYEPAAEDVHNSLAYEPAEDALTKWKRDAEEWQRKCEQATAARKADEARIIRERQAEQRTEVDALAEATGEFVAEVRAELRKEFADQLAELRDELLAKPIIEDHDSSKTLDLPVVRKVRIA